MDGVVNSKMVTNTAHGTDAGRYNLPMDQYTIDLGPVSLAGARRWQALIDAKPFEVTAEYSSTYSHYKLAQARYQLGRDFRATGSFGGTGIRITGAFTDDIAAAEGVEFVVNAVTVDGWSLPPGHEGS